MISVCIATYNGERFIKQQIESILPQLNVNDELIISDDSSTDNTLQVISSFQDERIIVFESQRYKSPIFNFENAIKRSIGDIIFLSDQDDIWHPNKVEEMVKALTNYEMAICDCTVINDNGEILVGSYFNKMNSSPGVLKNLYKNSYVGCCMAFKREVLKKALPFPKDIPMHDMWLGFVSELFYKSIFTDTKLTFYRMHDNNASITSDDKLPYFRKRDDTVISSNIKSHFGFWKKIMFRVNLLKYLPLLMRR